MDKTITTGRANLLALALAPLVLVVFFLPFLLLWGSASLQTPLERMRPTFLVLLAASIVLHEGLHGVGFTLIGRVPWREVRFGLKGLMAYAHCRVPVAASAYRVAVALPGALLGLLPGLIGIAWGNGWLTVYGSLMGVASLGDLIILWLIRAVPRAARVQDHPSAPGCRVAVE